MKTNHTDTGEAMMSDDNTCERCGYVYSLRDGCEPTTYCDLCAHKVVKEQQTTIKRLTDQLKQLQRKLDSARPLHEIEEQLDWKENNR